MLEKDLENIIIKYPELIEDGLRLIKEQGKVCGRKFDLMFEDKYGQKVILELKRGAITDKHIGQILYYEGTQLSEESQAIRIILVGTRVPPSIQKALDYHGIGWREITIPTLIEFLSKKGDSDFLSIVRESLPLADIREGRTNQVSTLKIAQTNIEFGDKIQKNNYHACFQKLVQATAPRIGLPESDFHIYGDRNYCQITRYKCHFEWWITVGRGKGEPYALQVALHFERSEEFNKRAVALILTPDIKGQLERELNEEVFFGPWSDRNNKWASIYIVKNGNIFTQELFEWAVKNMAIFYKVLSPKIELLKSLKKEL